MSNENMTLHLKIWRQKDRDSKGRMVDYTLDNVSPHMSFLEMLDVLNENLVKKGEEQIEFDNDCREGICGMCSLVIGGTAHGPWRETATCQLHMREYKNGDTITIEPFRAAGFPVIKDLVVNRDSFDRIIAAGGYTSINAGGAQDANTILIPKEKADLAMDAASCIGCGACVAACPNGSASLFVAAKISQFALLPQGAPERKRRAQLMIEQMDKEGFGNCSNHGECEAVCPKGIKITKIARMRREFFKSVFG